MPDMQSKKLAGSKPGLSTQKFLDIAEIKDGTVIMKDGTLRSVLMVSSINFALKSEDEQKAIIGQYISFLNALEYPLQIVIQSRRLNIDKYLERLKNSQADQKNELLRMQIADYRNFVQELVTIGQIMQKQFFVVVSYNPLSDRAKSFWTRTMEVMSPIVSLRLAEEVFRRRKADLDGRTENIESSLISMGLKSVRLDTQSLIELYYRVYNPETYDTQKMIDVDKLRVTENTTTI
jgi:hypothetical protein